MQRNSKNFTTSKFFFNRSNELCYRNDARGALLLYNITTFEDPEAGLEIKTDHEVYLDKDHGLTPPYNCIIVSDKQEQVTAKICDNTELSETVMVLATEEGVESKILEKITIKDKCDEYHRFFGKRSPFSENLFCDVSKMCDVGRSLRCSVGILPAVVEHTLQEEGHQIVFKKK